MTFSLLWSSSTDMGWLLRRGPRRAAVRLVVAAVFETWQTERAEGERGGGGEGKVSCCSSIVSRDEDGRQHWEVA